MKRVVVTLCVVMLTCVMFSQGVFAADWKPSKAIQLIVPAGAGGGTDLSARTFAKYAQKILGKPVVVVNVKGAGGYNGTRQVFDGETDGQKVLYYHGNVVMNKMAGIAPYSTDGFEQGPIVVEDGSMSLFVQGDGDIKTIEDLVVKAKANPGKLKAATEFGAFTYFMYLKMQKELDIKLNLVDVGGGAAKQASMLSGIIDVMAKLTVGTKPFVDAGKFTILGCMQDERVPNAKWAPTLKENGVSFNYPAYQFALFFTKGTPQNIQTAFNDVAKEVTSNPAFQKEILKIGFNPKYYAPEVAHKNFIELEKMATELAKEKADVKKQK